MSPIILPRAEASLAIAETEAYMRTRGLLPARSECFEILAAGMELVEASTAARQVEPRDHPELRGMHFELAPEPYGPAWAVRTVNRLLYAPIASPRRAAAEGVEALLREANTHPVVHARLCDTLNSPDRLALARLYDTLIGDYDP